MDEQFREQKKVDMKGLFGGIIMKNSLCVVIMFIR